MVSGERGSPFKKAGILGLAYHLYLILPWEENQFIPIPVSEIAGYELLVALLPTALIPTVARDS